jgi:hypothetical protein
VQQLHLKLNDNMSYRYPLSKIFDDVHHMGDINFEDHVDEIINICKDMRYKLLSKSPLLELDGGINICGL